MCVRVCARLNVCWQDVTRTPATLFDGAQIWWGNSCRTLASFPPCVQSNHMGLPFLFLYTDGIAKHYCVQQRGNVKEAGSGYISKHSRKKSYSLRTGLCCRKTTKEYRAEQCFTTHQLIERHLWAFFIKQVPPCGSTHCSKTHISYRKNSQRHIYRPDVVSHLLQIGVQEKRLTITT